MMRDQLPVVMASAAIDLRTPTIDGSAIPSLDVVATVAATDPVAAARALSDHPDAGLVVTGGDPRTAIDVGLDMGRPILVASQPGRWCDDADTLIVRLASPAAAASGWLPARFDPDCVAVDAALRSGKIGDPVAIRVVRTGAPGVAMLQGCDLTGVIDLAVRWAGSEVEHIASLDSADSTDSATTVCASVVFTSGATALVEAGSVATYGAAGFRETVLIGTTGAFELPWDPTASLILTGDGMTQLDEPGPTSGTAAPRRIVDDWVEAVHQARPASVTAADYVRACQLAWAARCSAANDGQVVRLAVPAPPGR